MIISNNKMTTLSLVLATLALAGCSSCPAGAGYDQFPYNNIRTAGTGATTYGDCKAAPVKYVAPAPVVVKKKAEAVFTKSQRK